MTILDANHPRKKPLDFGYYGVTGSVDYRNGGLIALNSYHPEHGYVTLTSAEPFPDDQRYDAAAVRRYRASLATLPGFGYQVDQPVVNATYELLEDAIPRIRFEYENGSAEYTFLTGLDGCVRQIMKFEGVTARWNGSLCLMRSAYTQLTEGGVIPALPVQMKITFNDGDLTMYSPSLKWAVAISGFPALPDEESWTLESNGLTELSLPDVTGTITLVYYFDENAEKAASLASARVDLDTDQLLGEMLQRYQRYFENLPADPLLRRGLVYSMLMVVPTNKHNSSAILTDHMLLPLSWNRDAYYVARALFVTGQDSAVYDHLCWMFYQAERINGFWGRCYLANGFLKDSAFQLDQQLYPFLELWDYYLRSRDNQFLEFIVINHFLPLWDALCQRKHPTKFLLPTDETPGDDPINFSYHLSSHLLLELVLSIYSYAMTGFLFSESDNWEKYRDTWNGRIEALENDLIALRQSIQENFIVEHNGERIYAYATDGAGNHHLYHDANDLPFVLAPLWGVLRHDDPVWQATIRFAFSEANKGGNYGGHLGSVHTPAPWPLGDLQEWLIAQIQGDYLRIERASTQLKQIAQWDGALPEAYNLEDGSVASRHWFAWPGAVYALNRMGGWFSSRYPMTLLETIYGADKGHDILPQFMAHLQANKSESHRQPDYFSEKTVTLITYGDSIITPDESSLKTLHRFLNKYVKGVIDTIHILPFYPYSSDDGFSVIDYYAVNPDLGDWSDIAALKEDFRLMFDAVINHMSAESEWFRRYLAHDPEYEGLFFTESPETDLSSVTRPRTSPLLTPFTDVNGDTQHLWTTFSADQIDLDYRNPQTLLRILDVLLFYVNQGASVIRLDAIAYMWKQAGTTSIHLPETHAIIQFLQNMLRGTILITETNVPHAENISYFGKGYGEEANLVYNFTLPPLLLHTIYQGNATKLSDWINSLEVPQGDMAFFNFTASHDGIGVRPVEGILTREELDALIAGVETRNGRVSWKNNPDGSRSPYELNITYVDAVSAPGQPEEVNIRRFLLSQGVLLALAGVPAIYIHSLLGSHNDLEGMARTGHNRSINRAKLNLETLEAELAQPDSFRAHIFNELKKLITIRTAHEAFSPRTPQNAYTLNDGHVLALQRSVSDDAENSILAVFNFSGDTQIIPEISGRFDLLTDSIADESLPPFGMRWLRAE